MATSPAGSRPDNGASKKAKLVNPILKNASGFRNFESDQSSGAFGGRLVTKRAHDPSTRENNEYDVRSCGAQPLEAEGNLIANYL